MHPNHFHQHEIIDSKIELREIYWSMVLLFFSISMISLFIPVYLWKLGYDLVTIALFWGVLAGAQFLAMPVAAKLSERIGLKHTMMLSIPFLIGFYFFVNLIPSAEYPILLLALVLGVYRGLYWFPLDHDFAQNYGAGKENAVGMLFVLPRVGKVLGPIMGAIILIAFDFHILFYLVIMLAFISAIPLFYTKDFPEKEHFNFTADAKLFPPKFFAGSIVDGFMFSVEEFF
jgi:MFS family permease